MLLWIVLLPLAGAVVNGLFGRFADRQMVGLVGVGTIGLSFFLAVVAFLRLLDMQPEGDAEFVPLQYSFYEWFSIHLRGRAVPIDIAFVFDALSGVMTLVVTGIGLLIHIYSLGYMSHDRSFARFFAYLNLFSASMLVLVLAGNLPVMFIGWEGVGLCSYLLIGFWYETPAYAAAGRKAFVVNRIGDFGVLIGMFILVAVAGSFDFASINHSSYSGAFTLAGWEAGTLATVACLFIFLGCTGKSAQIPLYVWLPDAMAGPTPVSALIHAATMVTAGVYLCCRLSPVFVQSPVAMSVVAVVGTLTALVAATIAVAQREMKKILAYSTVSQLGFMFAAVGVGAFAAGFFHVFTHAFFKACLFLGAGSVMHAVGAHGDADIFKLGGLRSILPRTHITFLLSCCAIAGVPMFSGFFSKDEILLGAAQLGVASDAAFLSPSIGWFVFGGLAIAATLTAFYMFRLYFLTFTGEYRSAGASDGHGSEAHGSGEHGYDASPHESPASMTGPLVVLGVGAVCVGWLGLPHLLPFTGAHLPHVWGEWLKPALAHVEFTPAGGDPLTAVNIAFIAGVSAMAVGIGLAYSMYANKSSDPIASGAPASLYSFLQDKWRVDELYAAVVLRPVKGLARICAWIDQTFVDVLLTKVTSGLVTLSSFILTRAQTGVMHAYGFVMALGVAGLMLWFWSPHPDVMPVVKGQNVEFTAGRGLGYEYRWDLNADGTFEVPSGEHASSTFGSKTFGSETSASHRYTPDDFRGFILVAAAILGEDIEIPLSEHAVVLDPEVLGPDWQVSGDAALPPAVRVEGNEVVIRPNSAAVYARGKLVSEKEVRLPAGSRLRIGQVPMRIAPVVQATLEVRNAFGNVARETVDVTIDVAAPAGARAEVVR